MKLSGGDISLAAINLLFMNNDDYENALIFRVLAMSAG